MNGYRNYETWLTVTWFNTEESTYKYWTERAEKIMQDWGDDFIHARYLLAGEIRDAMEEYYLEEKTVGLKWDLLSHAINNIDFEEVAEDFMER